MVRLNRKEVEQIYGKEVADLLDYGEETQEDIDEIDSNIPIVELEDD